MFEQGNACMEQARFDDAAACYGRALALAPDFAAAHANLGAALLRRHRVGDALMCFRRALVLEPDMADAHYNIGMVFYDLDPANAKPSLRKYLQLRPDNIAARLALADVHMHLNEIDDAQLCYRQVLQANPASYGAHNGLANTLRNQARHAEAVRHYELAIRHGEHPVVAFQNLLFCMMCMAGVSAREVHEKHREFAARFEQPLLGAQLPHENTADPQRRLRIGYVSPHMRTNVVAHYIEPVLRHHDRSQFEIFCYSAGMSSDSVTAQMAALFDQWHDVHLSSDDEIAALIRSHRIDVLVDLCGHGGGNRILIFARKPAPVQISYLDYSTTTGLASMDYRITNAYCDPVGSADRYYSEELHRLDTTFWTYNPSIRLPVDALPAQSAGCVTFGSFSLYYRITAEVLALWARVLRAIPASRLLIIGVAEGSTRKALLETLGDAGIAPERIVIRNVVDYRTYHELMGEVDVALAPFPYNGATTIMDCLWNGLPVVSMGGGESFYARMGCSILPAVGLSRLIAADAEDYVRIATDLAADLPALAGLRLSLRERLEQSPMRDFPGFTRAIEQAYRAMWREWCSATQAAGSSPAETHSPIRH